MNCDLHIHTNLSDGSSTVSEIIEVALDNNVLLLSITDHNIIDAYKDLILPNKIKIITGVEISVLFDNYEYHFLMYGFDINNKYILNYNKISKEYSKLYNDHFCITMEELFRLEKNTSSIVSLAHPTKYFSDFKDIEEFILMLKKKYNLRAVEAITSRTTKEKQDYLINFCKSNDLYISGGSDYHSKKGDFELKKIGNANGIIRDIDLTILRMMRWVWIK